MLFVFCLNSCPPSVFRRPWRLCCSPCPKSSSRWQISVRFNAPRRSSTTSLPSARASLLWDGSPWWVCVCGGGETCVWIMVGNNPVFDSVCSAPLCWLTAAGTETMLSQRDDELLFVDLISMNKTSSPSLDTEWNLCVCFPSFDFSHAHLNWTCWFSLHLHISGTNGKDWSFFYGTSTNCICLVFIVLGSWTVSKHCDVWVCIYSIFVLYVGTYTVCMYLSTPVSSVFDIFFSPRLLNLVPTSKRCRTLPCSTPTVYWRSSGRSKSSFSWSFVVSVNLDVCEISA